jgi:hypothetical protein
VSNERHDVKLTFSASVEVFDKDKYLAAVREEVRRVFMKAGQKFLLAAIPRIPVWTGMARGAFRNAEDLFGKVTNDAQSSGVRIRTTRGANQGRGGGSSNAGARRGWYYKPPGGSVIERSPQAGRQFATPSDKIFDNATLATGRTAFYFRFEVDITYFTRFDDAKWGAFKAGGQALEDYVRANLKLPDPLKFMTRKTYTVK